MSDRMPEDLPVRKCINVMVGITRSKVMYVNLGCIYEIYTAYIYIYLILYIYIYIFHGITSRDIKRMGWDYLMLLVVSVGVPGPWGSYLLWHVLESSLGFIGCLWLPT